MMRTLAAACVVGFHLTNGVRVGDEVNDSMERARPPPAVAGPPTTTTTPPPLEKKVQAKGHWSPCKQLDSDKLQKLVEQVKAELAAGKSKEKAKNGQKSAGTDEFPEGDGSSDNPTWTYFNHTCFKSRYVKAAEEVRKHRCQTILEVGGYITPLADFLKDGPVGKEEKPPAPQVEKKKDKKEKSLLEEDDEEESFLALQRPEEGLLELDNNLDSWDESQPLPSAPSKEPDPILYINVDPSAPKGKLVKTPSVCEIHLPFTLKDFYAPAAEKLRELLDVPSVPVPLCGVIMGLWDAQVATPQDRASIEKLTKKAELMILESPQDQQTQLETVSEMCTKNGYNMYNKELVDCFRKAPVRESTAKRYMRFFKKDPVYTGPGKGK